MGQSVCWPKPDVEPLLATTEISLATIPGFRNATRATLTLSEGRVPNMDCDSLATVVWNMSFPGIPTTQDLDKFEGDLKNTIAKASKYIAATDVEVIRTVIPDAPDVSSSGAITKAATQTVIALIKIHAQAAGDKSSDAVAKDAADNLPSLCV